MLRIRLGELFRDIEVIEAGLVSISLNYGINTFMSRIVMTMTPRNNDRFSLFSEH